MEKTNTSPSIRICRYAGLQSRIDQIPFILVNEPGNNGEPSSVKFNPLNHHLPKEDMGRLHTDASRIEPVAYVLDAMMKELRQAKGTGNWLYFSWKYNLNIDEVYAWIWLLQRWHGLAVYSEYELLRHLEEVHYGE